MQTEGLKRDAARVSAENNKLHLQLLKTADVADKAEKEHYQHTKQLEGQVTELACWKHQTSGRFQTLEKENSGLRAKLEELLRLGERFPRRMHIMTNGLAFCSCGPQPVQHDSHVCVMQLMADCLTLHQPWQCHTLSVSHITQCQCSVMLQVRFGSTVSHLSADAKPASTAVAALPTVSLLKTADDRCAADHPALLCQLSSVVTCMLQLHGSFRLRAHLAAEKNEKSLP